MKKSLLLGVAIIVFSGAENFAMVPALASDDTSKQAEPQVLRDVDYLLNDRPEKADIYLPAGRAANVKSPAVLVIHGGGWTTGDKAEEREVNIATNLAKAGYVAMSINYLLSTAEHKATWPVNVFECQIAVRWLRKNAERFQIDGDHIGVIGGSAGGHLAASIAVLDGQDATYGKPPYREFSCKVQCAVDLYGPIDLLSYKDLPMIGGTREEDFERYYAASPNHSVQKNTPPILIVHGTADKSVSINQSRLFARALERAGATYELVIVEGAPDSFHLQPKQRDLRPVVIGFLDRYLKPKK
jgi:acetyl esterase/lipase